LFSGAPVSLPRVVELVRVSSDGQHDRGTPDAQRHALDRLRELRPGRILARIDPPHGVSGALPVDQRPDILELRRLVEQHGLDELRVYDLDRLSRAESPLDRLAVLAICADAGAVIVDASGRELDPRSDAGELTYYLHTLFARQERRRLLARTIAGRQRAARAGKLAGGLLPYALRWTGAEVVVDEDEAAVVRRIFELVAGGMKPSEVVDTLNAEGVPSATGRRWKAPRVIDIVRRRAYIGTLEQHQGGEAYELRTPALVDEATWRAANAAIDRRRAWSGRPIKRGTGLVQGLVRCGVCGQSVYASASHGRVVYLCRSRHMPKLYGPPCGADFHRADIVDEAVWAEIVALVTEPSVLLAAIAPSTAPSSSRWAEQLERCERELARLVDREVEWLRLHRRDRLSTEALERLLDGNASDRATFQRSADLAREALAAEAHAAQLAADVTALLPELAERVRTAAPEHRRPIVEALVQYPGCGVTLHSDGRIEIAGALAVPAAPKVDAAACSRADFGSAETARILPFRRGAA
jgi:DNA invertase Pin-like site-specific DNA recombinase